MSVLYVACRSRSVIVRLLVSRSPRRASRCTRAADGCSSSPRSSTGRCGRDRGEPSPFNYREDRTPTHGRGDPRGRDGGVREELATGVVQLKPKTEVEVTSILPSLDVKTAHSWRGIVPFTHLAREGRMTVTIGRRELLAALGGAAAWPLAAKAQQPTMPVIGLLGSATAREWAPSVAAFLRGLSEAGFAEGRDVAIESRWAENQYDRLPSLAAELIHRQVSVITALTTPSAIAAKAATATIPIVFTTIADPVQIGLVASLNRPGGNLTGVTFLNVEIVPKMLELLHEVVPTATTMAALINPTNPNADTWSTSLQVAARTLGLELNVLRASTERDIDTAFATLIPLRVGGLAIVNDVFIITREEQLAALALRHRVPTIFQTRASVVAGGLMSYAGSASDAYRQAGVYTGRVLKGEKPADLPVQRSAKVELVINLKTAKMLGLTFPITLLGRADEVIE